MGNNINLIDDIKRKMLVKYPRFGSKIASTNIEYRTDLKYHTAGTDGKVINITNKQLRSLQQVKSEKDKLKTIRF